MESQPHLIDQPLPELVAAFLVNADVTDDCVLPCAGRDIDQHRVSVPGLMHSKLKEFLLGAWQRIVLEFPALNEHPDLPGGAPLGFLDRLHNAPVIEPSKEVMCAHLPATTGSAAAKASSTRTEAPKATAGGAARPPATSPISGDEWTAKTSISIAAAAAGGAYCYQEYQ